jgi:streptogramin lyase
VVNNNILLAATAEGVKLAPANAANLQNYLSWTHFDYSLGLPAKPAAHVEVANSKYYAAISDTLFQFSAGTWSKLAYDSGWVIKNLETIDGKLYISQWYGEAQSRVGVLDSSGVITYLVPPIGVRTIQYVPDAVGNIWIADLYNGMIKNGEKVLPNGPYTTSCFALKAQGDNMFVAGGGTNSAFDYTYNVAGMYMLNEVNRSWKNYNIYNTPALAGFLDVIGVAANEAGTRAYFCSNLDGIAILNAEDGSVVHYDYSNSPLQDAVGSPGATRVTNIAVDKNANVWMTNFNTYSPLVLLKPDGTWKRFPLLLLDQLGKKMIIDRNGYKWIPTRKPDGIMVYYEGDDIDNSNDDVSRFLSSGSGNGNLNNVIVNAIVEDKDGDVWVGTDEGIEIFYCAGSVLSQNSCDAQRIVVERDGFNGYLFGTEVIRSITIDAANRKWVGTNSGAWLISANGKEELLHFTTENSPLPSNFVSDITVNNTTGEVFFATEKGIASFLGDAISGGETCTGAFVYPNPVKPEYTGPIAIKGLVDDAYVKITDVSGLLVYQGKANGGQMIWNGNDYNGRRAASGIYTVFSSTPDGKGGKCVGKIAFIN